MKSSKYNYFVRREDGNYTAFNAFSGALGVITPEVYHFCNTIESIDMNTLSEKEQSYLSALKESYLLVENELDEIKEVTSYMNSRKHDLTILGLTIMPTSACNLSCTYCYEKQLNDQMDEQVKDALVDFAEERIMLAKSLDITWYGGEPLLAVDTIVDLSNRLIDLADKHKANYSAGIITNGTLLTRETALILRDQCQVSYCQVTLDGPEEVHNKRRPFVSRSGDSFNTILENVKDVADILEVHIRINVDKENTDQLEGLLDVLKENGLEEKIKIHIGLTEPLGEQCECMDTRSKCLDDELMPELQIQFFKMADERGFSPLFYLVPANVFGLCAAEVDNSFVIEPNGDIQKCWVTVGNPEERIGTVWAGVPASVNLQKWTGFNPLEKEECKNCRVLPLCWGNCVYRAQQEVDGQHCGMWKYQLENVLSQIEEFEHVMSSKDDDTEDIGMARISPTFTVKRGAQFDMEKQEIEWLYKGRNAKKRCCFVVCFRCTHLGVSCDFKSCKPVNVSNRPR